MLCSVNSRMHVFLLQFINFEIETNPTIRAILQLLWVWIEKLSSCRKDLCLLLPLTGGTINLSPCTLYSLSRSFWTTLVNSYFSDLHKHCLLWFQFPGDMFSPHPSSEGWMLYKHCLLWFRFPGDMFPPHPHLLSRLRQAGSPAVTFRGTHAYYIQAVACWVPAVYGVFC